MHECVINPKLACPKHKISGRDCSYCKIPDIRVAPRHDPSVFKIKFEGVSVRVKFLLPHEIITDRCLYRIVDSEHDSTRVSEWFRSQSVGDRVITHPRRQYVQVVSAWWK